MQIEQVMAGSGQVDAAGGKGSSNLIRDGLHVRAQLVVAIFWVFGVHGDDAWQPDEIEVSFE